MARRTARRARKAVTESASALQGVIDSAEEFLGTLREQKGEAVELVRDKISATVKNAREQLAELNLSELAADAADSTMGFLRSDPWRTVALGALTVLAISLVVRNSGDD